jgi:NAD(P)H-dependent FMN reductase
MSRLVGVSGAVSARGTSTSLLREGLRAAENLGHRSGLIDLRDAGIEWCDGRDPASYGEPTKAAIQVVASADACLFATPVYRGSFSGRFKNFLDVLPGDVLVLKPVAMLASGGSFEHALSLDFAMRPVLAQMGALVLPRTVYATQRDFSGNKVSPELRDKIEATIHQLLELTEGTANE